MSSFILPPPSLLKRRKAKPVNQSIIKRVDRGRGHSYYIDGVKADGVTTLIGDGLPKPALINWAANTTAGYAIDNWAELSDLPVSERLEKLKKARWQQLDEAGRRGTEVHRLAEELAHGREVAVPDEIAGHVESAVRFLDEWKVETIRTETVVANPKWGYCGTFDLVGRLPDGRVVLFDWKTSRSGIFGEAALQLAAYRHAEIYRDGLTDHPMSELGITDTMAVWVRADDYDVYPLDTSEDTFKLFQHIAWVARKGKGLRDLVGSAAERPTEVTA